MKAYIVLSKGDLKRMLETFSKNQSDSTTKVTEVKVVSDDNGDMQIDSFQLAYHFGEVEKV